MGKLNIGQSSEGRWEGKKSFAIFHLPFSICYLGGEMILTLRTQSLGYPLLRTLKQPLKWKMENEKWKIITSF